MTGDTAMDEYVSTPVYIRTNSTAGFRSGQWAKILRLAWLPRRHGESPREPRVVFCVEFVDGVGDLWPIDDPSALYEFAGTPGYDTAGDSG